jgi:hypothetical protein
MGVANNAGRVRQGFTENKRNPSQQHTHKLAKAKAWTLNLRCVPFFVICLAQLAAGIQRGCERDEINRRDGAIYAPLQQQ